MPRGNLGLDVAEVVDRYGDLGFDVADAVGSLERRPSDVGDGKQVWRWGAADPGRVGSQAADQLRISTDEAILSGCATRDSSCSTPCPIPTSTTRSSARSGQDHQLERVIFYHQSVPVERRAIIELAARSGRQAAGVAADLRAVGLIVPPMNDLGVVDDELQQMCAESS